MATIARLVASGGIVAPKGAPGSMLMFHCNLVHGSPSNMSPWNRVIVYLSLCGVSNHIRRFKVGTLGTLRLRQGVVTDDLTTVTFCAENVDQCGL